MVHLLIVVLNDLSKLPDLLKSWKRIGVPGVTLLHSVGGFHIENWMGRMGLGAIGRLFDQQEVRQRTLLSLIEGDELLELAISEADEAVGGFDRPHSGILFTFPISRVLGLQKWGARKEIQPLIEYDERIQGLSWQLNKTTIVSDIIDVLKLDPAIVPVGAKLSEVVEELSRHPNVQIACVVNDVDRLVGLIDARLLSKALFLSIFPGEFLSDLDDLEEVLAFADRTKIKTASDIMQKPAWVHLQDSLEQAFHVVHEGNLPGIPVVDEYYHVIGYINLIELMLVCLKGSTDKLPSDRISK